jgi:adenine-specific DNA-methyltransferase
MAKTGSKDKAKKKVETLTHGKASRLNIPTAEYQSVMRTEELSPVRVAYDRRNRDLDPQLVWRGKDEQDWSDLVVPAPPLYIQEKIHPKVLIDDLQRRSEANAKATEAQIDLFANFNGLPSEAAKTEFYQHDAHWSNRMILGDSLQVMASLAEREGLRGKVQCVYFDPPYGIKFNSNFQWSTTSRDVIDGRADHITREPEQVRAFRDTWRDGIHSYLTYLRDRLTVARDLLSDSGSIFVQIGDENVHRVRSVLDEVFGEDNFVVTIPFVKKGNQKGTSIESINDFIIWFAKRKSQAKIRNLFKKSAETEQLERDFKRVVFELRDLSIDEFAAVVGTTEPLSALEIVQRYPEARLYTSSDLTVGGTRTNQSLKYVWRGIERDPGLDKNRCWMHTARTTAGERYCGIDRLNFADRIIETGAGSMRRRVFLADSGVTKWSNWWDDTGIAGFASEKVYVVQTNSKVIERCILMASDPGDLVLDPTCGSGTTAFVAEQWGRRWITTDTSRVALALARTRVMGARYPYYLLADSPQGQAKEAELQGKAPSGAPTHGNIRQGFVYERAPSVTSSLVANNAEIDVIWDDYQTRLEPLRNQLNAAVVKKWQEWEIPREKDEKWTPRAKELHVAWWEQRIARQKAIDASIAAKAEFEYLYDRPYEDNKKVRVAGPFTVESLSPHRVLVVGDDEEVLHKSGTFSGDKDDEANFVEMILENLKTSGVQQAHKEDKLTFSSITPWPGYYVCAEGKYTEANGKAGPEKRAAIFVGPEFGTVSRLDLVSAAKEAGDAGFDVLVTCAFNYDAHSSDFNRLGRIPVLKARMNADLHMSDELKNTGKGNLFVIFGEPDIQILKAKDDQIQVKIIGVDVFHPTTGEVRSDGAEGIACWFVDSDYNEESFFVRQAYFLGAHDPYKALKTTLKAEINEEAWATLNRDTSRPFDKPKSSRIAVKVINHLGDEVMKVFKV